jgi:hypothetical protein
MELISAVTDFKFLLFWQSLLIFVCIHTLYESSCVRFARNINVAGILCNDRGCHLRTFCQGSDCFVNFKELIITVWESSDWDSNCHRFFQVANVTVFLTMHIEFLTFQQWERASIE